jgi:hypothetical protein
VSAGNGEGASLSLTYTEAYPDSDTYEGDGLDIERAASGMEILKDLFLPEE